jgi:hypothetical protein
MADGDEPPNPITRDVEEVNVDPASDPGTGDPVASSDPIPSGASPDPEQASPSDTVDADTDAPMDGDNDGGFSLEKRFERLTEPSDHELDEFDDDPLAETVNDLGAHWAGRDAVEDARLGQRVALNVRAFFSKGPGETWEPIVELLVGLGSFVWFVISSEQEENNGGDGASTDPTPGGQGAGNGPPGAGLSEGGLPNGGAAP